jgi:hypothetical protein
MQDESAYSLPALVRFAFSTALWKPSVEIIKERPHSGGVNAVHKHINRFALR